MSTLENSPKDFLGRGWRFPVAIDPLSGRIATSEFERDIRESITIILSTARGERVMRQDFGCGIHDLVFASMNTSTLGLFESNIRESIIQYEPRVEIVKLDLSTAESDTGKLKVKLFLRIRETNHEFNMVYPFYLKEGTP
ncbi:MAG: GPW/gp25 family protein [Nitrospira sp.]|jgi:phage baseplate assembly protein W|nr:GPW/gp25 family protein [Nitrospira sp.]